MGCAVRKPNVSVILPVSTIMDSIPSIDQAEQSVQIPSKSEERKDKTDLEEGVGDSCLHWTARRMIYLLYLTLLACLIAVLIFTLVCYAFDAYWLERSLFRANETDWLDEDTEDLLTDVPTVQFNSSE